jgi:hypothetical protein
VARNGSSSDESGCFAWFLLAVFWAIFAEGISQYLGGLLGVPAKADWPFYVVFFVPLALFLLLGVTHLFRAIRRS